jgi:acyl dehydratase
MREVKRLYLDDLSVGHRFTSSTYLMEEPRIKEFVAEFDPQPFHLDDAAAEASVFKGLAASGWRTAAVSMRLFVPGGLPLATGIVRLLSLDIAAVMNRPSQLDAAGWQEVVSSSNQVRW